MGSDGSVLGAISESQRNTLIVGTRRSLLQIESVSFIVRSIIYEKTTFYPCRSDRHNGSIFLVAKTQQT